MVFGEMSFRKRPWGTTYENWKSPMFV